MPTLPESKDKRELKLSFNLLMLGSLVVKTGLSEDELEAEEAEPTDKTYICFTKQSISFSFKLRHNS